MGIHFINSIHPTLKDIWNENMQEAWSTLFNYIIAHMSIGYYALQSKDRSTMIYYLVHLSHMVVVGHQPTASLRAEEFTVVLRPQTLL